MANSEIRSSRLQAAVEVKYTVFRPLVVEVLCVLFLDYARWLGQKQNTPTKLLPQADERRCSVTITDHP